MISHKPFGSAGRCRPWASARHRSRFGLMEQLRREFGGDPTAPARADALDGLAPDARRAIRDRADEVTA